MAVAEIERADVNANNWHLFPSSSLFSWRDIIDECRKKLDAALISTGLDINADLKKRILIESVKAVASEVTADVDRFEDVRKPLTIVQYMKERKLEWPMGIIIVLAGTGQVLSVKQDSVGSMFLIVAAITAALALMAVDRSRYALFRNEERKKLMQKISFTPIAERSLAKCLERINHTNQANL